MSPLMARAWLVIAVTLVLLTPGCLDSGTIDQLWTDLEAEPKFQERSLFNDRAEFSPTGIVDPNDPPGGADDIGDRWSTNITIPEGTKTISVIFSVNFSNPDSGGLPVGAPNVPDGQVEIFVDGAGNESRNITLRESTTGGFDFQGPTPGEWTIGFDSIGQGTVLFRVFGTVPLTDST